MACECCPCPEICLAATRGAFPIFCIWAASGSASDKQHICYRSAQPWEPPPVVPTAATPASVPPESVSPAVQAPAVPLAGDLVAALAEKIGADRAANWVARRLVGLANCNCPQRQAALNALDAKVRRFLKWG